ncbi:hypothetical protein C8R42DRAFT_725420 [Lentinula raphanica]|nr:hypothetical protein C8R42DRAFT_725420 [Lentinula raphanica]
MGWCIEQEYHTALAWLGVLIIFRVQRWIQRECQGLWSSVLGTGDMAPRRNKPSKKSQRSSPARRGSSPATTRRGSSPASHLSISSDDGQSNLSDNAWPAKRKKVAKRLTMQEKALQFTSSFEEDLTNEEIRDKQVNSWTSKYYKHFTMPPEIDDRDPDVVRYQFHCKHESRIRRPRGVEPVSSDGLLYRMSGLHFFTSSAIKVASLTG